LGAQLCCPLQDFSVIARLHRDATELAEQRLLLQPVRKLITIGRFRWECGLFRRNLRRRVQFSISERALRPVIGTDLSQCR
jgi:hypothetical protein